MRYRIIIFFFTKRIIFCALEGYPLKNFTQFRATLLALHAKPTQLNDGVKVHHYKLPVPGNKNVCEYN